MAVVPIKSTVPPSDLAGQANGNLDLSLLTSIGPGSARLHHTVARGWRALKAAALEAGGWVLWWTSSPDTYRTYAVQLSTFLDRYQPVTNAVWVATPGERRKRWPDAPSLNYSSEWWIKRNIGTLVKPRYPATAAVPGTSPHGMGCAIDGALFGAPPVAWTAALPWLIAHAHLYGFAWSLQSEPWHIQWVMGDVIPQAVLEFEQPDPDPDPDPDPGDDDMAAPGIYEPADKDGVNWGYTADTPFFVVFPTGITVNATEADILYAESLGAKRFPVKSQDYHNRLLARAT